MRYILLLTIVTSFFVDSCGIRSGLDDDANATLATGGAQGTGGNQTGLGSISSTGGANGTGGRPATGGKASTGGASAASGFVVVGSAATAGGMIATGGATSTGDSGSGCTGSLEEIQRDTGLCVSKMVTIIGPELDASTSDAGSPDYQIDATEVTNGQYDAWLATSPPLPVSTDSTCGYVTSYAERGTDGVYTGADADHHPVVYVDWCDAYMYCEGVGKRLCGAIAGGSNAYASPDDATLSQWFRACSSGGGGASQYCDDYEYGIAQTVAVGSLANCVTSATGYAGVYDLIGNVFEWEDSCGSTSQSDICRIRGGAFYIHGDAIHCGNDRAPGGVSRNRAERYIGFRCCSL